jgi:zinc transport system permease protein
VPLLDHLRPPLDRFCTKLADGQGALFANSPADWLDQAVYAVNRLAPEGTLFAQDFAVRALLALVLVSLICGSVGSLVVAGRMAFFSDALAHCAFAGVSIGFLVFELFVARVRPAAEFWSWVTPVMIVFGMLVAYLIAAVHLRTGLSSDTVIGVFFAAAIGLAAMLSKLLQNRTLFNLEDFLFGNPLFVHSGDILQLALLGVVTAVVLALIYNHLLLAGFNSSLALSRRVPARLANYAFVILLAVIVNLCLRCVGALLINALLVVPAATAANWSRNMRQFFWLTIGLCLLVSLAGQGLSWEVEARWRIQLGIPGAIILLCVGLFVASMYVDLWRRRPAPAGDSVAHTPLSAPGSSSLGPSLDEPRPGRRA